MKTIKTSLVLIVAFLMIGSISGFSQKGGHGHGHGGKGHDHGGKGHSNGKSHGNPNKVMVVEGHPKQNGVVKLKSKYRPAKMVVYHPNWAPSRGYNRRWVYFPGHNFYWDNWRQGYYYLNGPVWVFKATPPATVININLDKEKSYELRDDEDDMDDVYKTNHKHKSEYKRD